jgi:hypothetical protein
MKTLRRGIAAAILALAMLLTAAVQPARAEDGGGGADGAADAVTDLALLAYRAYKARTLSPEQLVQFVHLVLGAISETDSAVSGHIDGLEASDVLGNLRGLTYTMSDYEALRENEIWVESYPSTLSQYAANAFEKYHAVLTKTAKDQIGLAGQSLYSTLLTVATDAGLNSTMARANADYVKLMQDIVRDLEPVCKQQPGLDNTSRDAVFTYTCTAANGKSEVFVEIVSGGVMVKGPVDLGALKAQAAKDSAWLAAKRTLAEKGN